MRRSPGTRLSPLASRLIAAVLCLAPVAGAAETLAEDLASRSPAINLRIDRPLDQLIPDCRENHPQSGWRRQCGDGVFVYFQGPYAIDVSSGPWVADLPFLNWALANLLRSSVGQSEYHSLSEHCTAQAIGALQDWITATPDLADAQAITVTYLSPDDPWAWCMHIDAFSWDYGRRHGQPPRDRSHEFWLWWKGEIVGQMNCRMANTGQDPQAVSPQCNLFFDFERGKYRLVIAPFAAANVGSVLRRSPAIARAFLAEFADETGALGLPAEMLEQGIFITTGAEAAFSHIEAEIQ